MAADYVELVRLVSRAKLVFEQAVMQPQVGPLLLGAAAGKLCAEYVYAREAARLDTKNVDEQLERYRGVELLLIIAAMRLGEEEGIEALRTMGTNGVDARSADPKQRWRCAGRDRPRPVTTDHGFRRRHLKRVEANLASSLYEMVRERTPTTCQEALDTYGEEAVRRYLRSR
jgi:hypothetical protein